MADKDEFRLLTPTVQMALACENVSTDHQGRITLHNLIDNLGAIQFPATTPQLFIVFGFYSPVASGYLVKPTIEIAAKNGDSIVKQQLPQDITFSPSAPQARVIIGLNGLTWPRADEYVVKFIANNGVKASFALKVGRPPGMSEE